ncbi:MAG: response regulator [Defluviitaleaceae bacterium]|nr:response regulator [Defluviitaleaceae bacterium]
MVNYKNMSVLIVDDVAIMRTVLKDILIAECGLSPTKIEEATSGETALVSYGQFKPDIVFLDIAMPDLDGKVVIERLLKIDADAIIIMCTGSGDKASVMECIRAGAKDYLRKPITADRLLKSLEKVLGDVVVKRFSI